MSMVSDILSAERAERERQPDFCPDDYCDYVDWEWGADEPCGRATVHGTNRCEKHLKNAATRWNVRNTWMVPVSNIPYLQERLAKLNRRAVKLGCDEIVLAIEPVKKYTRYIETVDSDLPVKITDWGHPVTVVRGGTFRLNGWNFVCRLDHEQRTEGEQAGEHATFIHSAPGEECPSRYRNQRNSCDHCGHDRERKSTFILRHEDGRLTQVGSTCLRDFLGHDPEAMVRFTAMIGEFLRRSEDDEDTRLGRTGDGFNLVSFLSMTALVMRTIGWVSKQDARDSIDGRVQSTADAVVYQLDLPKGHKDTAQREQQDFDAAQVAIEWCRDLEPTSDYEHNIRTLARHGAVSYRQAGFAASMIRAYQRHLEKLEADKLRADRQAQRAAESAYYGTLKQRVKSLAVTVAYVRGWDSDWGYTQLFGMRTEDGQLLIWKTTSDPSVDGRFIQAGHKLLLTGTVKEHSEYRGEKQTIMTRCKVAEVEGFDYSACEGNHGAENQGAHS